MIRHELNRYDVYKKSELEWLGVIPEHWDIVRIKDFTYVKGRIGWQGLRSTDFLDTGEYYCVTGTDFINGKVNWSSCYFVSEERFVQDPNIQLKEDDLLITKDGTIGKIAIVKGMQLKATLNSGLFVTRPKSSKYTNNFMYWMLNSIIFRNFIDLTKGGSTIQHLYQYVFNQFSYVCPTLIEQMSIVNYLETKTAQIDLKIELLTQKAAKYGNLKKSIINEAVTKGLNRTAKMKDSGADWIGNVPENWAVVRVKELFYISRGRVISQTELIDNGKYPVYSSQTKNDGCLGYIDSFDYEGRFITWTTDGANAGTVFLRDGKFNCTNICGILKLEKKNHELEYLAYALQVSAKHNKRIDTNGAKIMSNEMMFIKIAVPPIDEQKEIARYLNSKTAQIDRISSVIETQIDKLKEIRKTLINDVVTGKIKVTSKGDETAL